MLKQANSGITSEELMSKFKRKYLYIHTCLLTYVISSVFQSGKNMRLTSLSADYSSYTINVQYLHNNDNFIFIMNTPVMT